MEDRTSNETSTECRLFRSTGGKTGKRVGRVVLLTVLVSSLLVPAAHGASQDNPQWEKEGSVLLSGSESLSTTGKAEGNQTLAAGKNTVVCKSLSFGGEPDIKGSTAPSPGTGAQTVVYEECEVSGSASCMINGESAGHAKFATEALKDTLVFASKTAAEKEESKTLTLLEPQGSTFAKISFSGTCPMTGEFKIIGGALLGENEKGEELSKTHKLDFPATALSVYYRNVCGHTQEVKIKAPEAREIKEGKEQEADAFDYAAAGLIAIGIVAVGILIFN
jgi:hypothetical protein